MQYIVLGTMQTLTVHLSNPSANTNIIPPSQESCRRLPISLLQSNWYKGWIRKPLLCIEPVLSVKSSIYILSSIGGIFLYSSSYSSFLPHCLINSFITLLNPFADVFHYRSGVWIHHLCRSILRYLHIILLLEKCKKLFHLSTNFW